MAQRRRPAPQRRAQHVRPRGQQRFDRRRLPRFNSRSPYARFGAIAAALALLAVLVLVVTLRLHWYLAWIAGWSIVTFFFYRFDKRRSKSPAERVPEAVLHGLSLIGGFPGGWLGRSYYRHKTLHPSFLITLVVSSLLHIGIALWLFGAPA